MTFALLPRLSRGARLALGLAACLAPLSSCTWLVRDGLEQSPAPCRDPGDCFAGQACSEGACVAVDPPDAPPPPVARDTLGPDGGVLEGPDGVKLIVPAGALDEDVEVKLVRASASLVPSGFVEAAAAGQGRFYAVVTEATFSPSATLEIPVEDDVCTGGGCVVYARSDDGGWSALADASPGDDGVAAALVSVAGTFAAGLPIVPVADAGPTDGGSNGEDAGTVDGGDGGDNDAGPPAFATCDLSAESCSGAGDEQCAPSPFVSGDGVCLRECANDDGGVPSACGCCGAVAGWSGNGKYCLPDAWCGGGQLGDACPNGTSDCDPTSTSACVDLGNGPVCTTSCDGSGQCGAGCCVGAAQGDAGASDSFCAPSSSCGALLEGNRCFDDDTCASGRCDSHDGVAPERCTSTCTPGSCGAGLCCHPTSCSGEWLCVPDEICSASTSLLCGDVCLSDAACDVDESCVDAACVPP